MMLMQRVPAAVGALALGSALVLAGACAGSVAPVALSPGEASCASCRMVVSDLHFAAQIVTPYDEPLFFDDLGCLKRFVEGKPLEGNAVIFVADHRTGQWIRADRAVYSTTASLTAPMGSHIVAHADESSRAADKAAAESQRVSVVDVLGVVPPGGHP